MDGCLINPSGFQSNLGNRSKQHFCRCLRSLFVHTTPNATPSLSTLSHPDRALSNFATAPRQNILSSSAPAPLYLESPQLHHQRATDSLPHFPRGGIRHRYNSITSSISSYHILTAMSVDVVVGTPLADALQGVVLPKLIEVGWSSGMQDDTLSEYIILMLANGKSQDQIASELSNDLLDLGPNDQGAIDFAEWLFDQVNVLGTQFKPAPTATANTALAGHAQGEAPAAGDADMGEAADGSGIMYVSSLTCDLPFAHILTDQYRPTGPKSMRNGKTRDKRMLGQLNKNLDRTGDAALHRIRGGAGVGRINSHSREPPKGPRQQQIQRGLAAAANGGRPMQAIPGLGMPSMGMQNGVNFQQPQQQQGMITLQTQQFQHMLSMMEEQANMMAQLAQHQQGFQGPGQFQHQNGRPLSDRVERRGRQHNQDRRPHHSQQGQTQQDVSMGGEDQKSTGEGGEEQAQKPAEETMCKWNTRCSKADCPFAHQGPVSAPHIAVDTSVVCEFGVRCKNIKCVGRHPSPAKKFEEMSKADCKFGPTCQNPHCPFKHPTAPPCRNGADCTEEGCAFWHNPVTCKYPECTFVACPYKHAEGQKKNRGPVKNKSWVANGGSGQAKEHVSERKFVDGEVDEPMETIIPGQTTAESELEVV
jgi:hypothetical protein